MLALAEIVIRTPHHDALLGSVFQAQAGMRETALLAPDIGKHPIAPFPADFIHGGLESGGVLFAHGVIFRPFRRAPGLTADAFFANGSQLRAALVVLTQRRPRV